MPKLEGFSSNCRVFFFDLDGTLAELAKPVEPSTVELLRALESKGKIALSSGKPLYYLSGFARQLGLTSPILMGENGALIQFGIDLPPKTVLKVPFPSCDKEALKTLRSEIETLFPEIWFQPNEICLTPFPTDKREWDKIQALADSPLCQDLQVYRHNDSFDFMPGGINKGAGVNLLAEYLGLSKENL
ncbi:MAG: HAD family phosphatase, partial [Bacilli bacterium]|nr:HAD family phosphatase [Bacilli bacterium]